MVPQIEMKLIYDPSENFLLLSVYESPMLSSYYGSPDESLDLFLYSASCFELRSLSLGRKNFDRTVWVEVTRGNITDDPSIIPTTHFSSPIFCNRYPVKMCKFNSLRKSLICLYVTFFRYHPFFWFWVTYNIDENWNWSTTIQINRQSQRCHLVVQKPI